MKHISSSTILNLGSVATFIAFPLLYAASHADGGVSLWLGLGLMAAGMIAPFVAKKYT